VVNFGHIFVVHVFELVDHPKVLIQALVVLEKVLFEIHNVLIGGLFGTVDINGSKVPVFGGLDVGQFGKEGGGVQIGFSCAHSLLINLTCSKNYMSYI